MKLIHLMAPMACFASALPVHAAPFMYLGADGFEFANATASWKMTTHAEGKCRLSLICGGNLLAFTRNRLGQFEVILGGAEHTILDHVHFAPRDKVAVRAEELIQAFIARRELDNPLLRLKFQDLLGNQLRALELGLGEEGGAVERQRADAVLGFGRKIGGSPWVFTLEDVWVLMKTYGMVPGTEDGVPRPGAAWGMIAPATRVALNPDLALTRPAGDLDNILRNAIPWRASLFLPGPGEGKEESKDAPVSPVHRAAALPLTPGPGYQVATGFAIQPERTIPSATGSSAKWPALPMAQP